MEFDWKALLPLIATALMPTISSFLFSLIQRASNWLQRQQTWLKVGLYTALSAGIAALGAFLGQQLPGDLSQFTPDTISSILLALFYAVIYRNGAKGATTTATSSTGR